MKMCKVNGCRNERPEWRYTGKGKYEPYICDSCFARRQTKYFERYEERKHA